MVQPLSQLQGQEVLDIPEKPEVTVDLLKEQEESPLIIDRIKKCIIDKGPEFIGHVLDKGGKISDNVDKIVKSKPNKISQIFMAKCTLVFAAIMIPYNAFKTYKWGQRCVEVIKAGKTDLDWMVKQGVKLCDHTATWLGSIMSITLALEILQWIGSQAKWLGPVGIVVGVLGGMRIVGDGYNLYKVHKVQATFQESIGKNHGDDEFKEARHCLNEELKPNEVKIGFKKNLVWINEQLNRIEAIAQKKIGKGSAKEAAEAAELKEKAVTCLKNRLSSRKWLQGINVAEDAVGLVAGTLLFTPAAVASPFIGIGLAVESLIKKGVEIYIDEKFVYDLETLATEALEVPEAMQA